MFADSAGMDVGDRARVRLQPQPISAGFAGGGERLREHKYHIIMTFSSIESRDVTEGSHDLQDGRQRPSGARLTPKPEGAHTHGRLRLPFTAPG